MIQDIVKAAEEGSINKNEFCLMRQAVIALLWCFYPFRAQIGRALWKELIRTPEGWVVRARGHLERAQDQHAGMQHKTESR